MAIFDCTTIHLKYGDISENVKTLQNNLRKFGYYVKTKANENLIVDGKFFEYTKEAVEDFQKAEGITGESGEFKQKTCEKLTAKVEELEKKNNTTTPATNTNNNNTNKATNQKVTNTKKTVIRIDPKKYNVVPVRHANLTIEGIHFIAEAITEKNAYGKNKQWKTLDMLNNRTLVYEGHSHLTEYDVTCYFHFKKYARIKNALSLMQNKGKCSVISELITSGKYYVSFDKTYDKPDLWKVTISMVKSDG